jgi:hypothetical protein
MAEQLVFYPVVNQVAIGEIHEEAGKLIVGDVDLVAKALAAWGGKRQLGRVTIAIELLPLGNVEVNPSLGKFVEASEPAGVIVAAT